MYRTTRFTALALFAALLVACDTSGGGGPPVNQVPVAACLAATA